MSKAKTATEIILSDTRRWLEHAVIGLNLCPFAKAVHVKGQIHYAVSEAMDRRELLADLKHELDGLVDMAPTLRDTTLLIAPYTLHDFLDFNDFLSQANRLLVKLGLEGMVQIASFHPDFQFAGTDPQDIGNFTNRSPYPMLHLLREDSVERAVAAYPQAELIFQKNVETLQKLGHVGWSALGLGPSKELDQTETRGKIEP